MGLSWPTIGGQPRLLPFDATPLAGVPADVNARIGWLLRVNRLGSAYGAMTAAEWTAELGLEVTRHTEISKLEHGSKRPSATVLSRYEQALGYLPGTFRGIVDGVRRRLAPDALATTRRQRRRWVVNELDDAIAAGEATGEQWLDAVDFLTAADSRALPRRVAVEWMATLAQDFATAPGLNVAPRLEALCVIADSERSAELEDVLWGLVNKTPEHARRLISVLGSSARSGIVTDLIAQLQGDRSEHLYGVAAALSDQLARGRVQPEHLATLKQVSLAAGTLSVALARGLLVSAGAQDGSDERAHRFTVGRMQRAPGLGRYLRAIQQAGTPEDRMVKRLLQESLVPILPGRALPAQLLLAASPYRQIVVDEARAIAGDPTASVAESQAATNLAWI